MSKKFGMQVIFGSSNLSPNNGPFLAVLHCPCSPGPYKIKLFFSPTRGAAVKFKPKRGKGMASGGKVEVNIPEGRKKQPKRGRSNGAE